MKKELVEFLKEDLVNVIMNSDDEKMLKFVMSFVTGYQSKKA